MVEINNVGGVGSPSNRPVGRAESAERSSSAARAGQAGGSDRVEISRSAREAQHVSALAAAAQEAPEVRQDVVDAAREQISNGDLLRQEIARVLAERIVDAIL